MAPKKDEEWNEEKRRQYDPYSHNAPYPYEEEKKKGGCCRCLFIIIVILVVLAGGAVGALIGIFGFEKVKSWVGLGSTEADSSPTAAPTLTPVYEFNQCPTSGDCCNGLASNCDLKVDEVLFATLHNAHVDETDAFPNHESPLEEALVAGYRGVMLDACTCDGAVTLCHGDCGFGKRDLTEVFTNINTFLDANKNDMLMINFEISVGTPTPSEIWDVIGPIIQSKTYTYTGGNWPTLKQLQTDDKQLIFFKHNGVTSSVNQIKEFHNFAAETPYEFKSVDEVEDTNNSCGIDRGAQSTKDFYAINNFVANELLGIPSKAGSEEVNEKNFLTQRLADCEAKTGLKTNFINIDFWEYGDVIEVVQEENKARAN